PWLFVSGMALSAFGMILLGALGARDAALATAPPLRTLYTKNGGGPRGGGGGGAARRPPPRPPPARPPPPAPAPPPPPPPPPPRFHGAAADNAGGVIRPTGAGSEYPGAAPAS
ncbi:YccS/YhfK family membrane protein, partial [Pseudomonas aeruginosa]|uniref:YccS/YhfK family membrane protein n=1 Tax=Pseudomonas aeruginosa TaxID=287 RepID=UPI0021F1B80A